MAKKKRIYSYSQLKGMIFYVICKTCAFYCTLKMFELIFALTWRKYLRAHNDGVENKIRETRDTMVYILVLCRNVNGLKTDLFPPLAWGSNVITSACHFN